jgi:hypothetical protein
MRSLSVKSVFSPPSFLFLITLLSRIPFRSRVLYHWDSVQHALATEHYDIMVHQPHPPGYFLYVMLGKLLNTITGDANTSFVALSIVVSAATVVVIYVLTRQMFNEKTALAASLLAMTSPFFWFYGEVAMNHIFDAFSSILLAYFCWRAISGHGWSLLIASLVLAFAGGIRQNTLLFLFPLWAFALAKSPNKYRLYAVALLVSAVISWFVPMVYLTGGYMRYRAACQELYNYSVGPGIHAGTEKMLAVSEMVFIYIVYGLGLSIAFFYPYFRVQGLKSFRRDLLTTRGIFFTLWILPSIFLYVFVFGHPVNPGYSLIYLPPFFVLAASALMKITEGRSSPFPHWVFALSLTVALFFNGYVFLFNTKNTPFSYSFLKKQQEYLNVLVKEVRARFSPANTVILGKPYVFLGPRHLMYYLPEYRVYVMDESTDSTGKRRSIFWGQNHSTYLSDAVYIPSGVKYFMSPDEPRGAVFLERKVLIEGDKTSGRTLPALLCYDIEIAPILYPSMKFVKRAN